MEPLDDLIFPHPDGLIGRLHEQRLITAALDAEAATPQVIYLVGNGGVGKTSLLQYAMGAARARRDAGRPILETGVVDLQDLRYNQPLMILRTLRNRLLESLRGLKEPTEGVFDAFDLVVRRYRDVFGTDPAMVNEQRRELEEHFVECFLALSRRYFVLILFDTFERLDYTISETERYNFRSGQTLEDWLVRLIVRLQHTLTIVAGRPRPRQLELLEGEALQLTVLRIDAFDLAESETFVRESLNKVEPELIPFWLTLHRLSGGRPIRLVIAIAAAHAGLLDLRAVDVERDDALKTLSDALDSLIFRHIAMDRPEIYVLLTMALHLRKGLRRTLIEQVWPAEGAGAVDVESVIATFRRLPIVRAIGDRLFTLHDELYDLLFQKMGGVRDAPELYNRAIAFLDQRIASGVFDPSEADYRTPIRQSLQVERLFYRLCLNPISGYQDYRELSYGAIRSHAHDFDALLRAELARFYDRETTWGRHYHNQLELSGLGWQRILYDESIRWVYRCITTHIEGENRYLKALKVSDEVELEYAATYRSDALGRADLMAARLEARLFLEDSELLDQEHESLVDEVQGLLEVAPADAHTPELRNLRSQYALLILAIVYYNWGYIKRRDQFYSTAIKHYKKSLELYAALGSENELSRAIVLNNCGYAMSLHGELERGLWFVNEALRRAELLGARHQVGVCLNTRSRIQLQLDQVNEALESVTAARVIFQEVDSKRNLALCLQAEGNIRRWIAYGYRTQARRSESEYRRALRCYSQAQTLQKKLDVGEVSRAVELLQSIGCAYRSRGFARLQRHEPYEEDMKRARNYLREALDLIPPEQYRTLPIVPSLLEDIAVSYVNENRFAEAQTYLQQARDAIPEAFKIQDGIGITDEPETREQRIYWLRLGQVELQYALCRFGEGKLVNACARLVRAFACMIAFSPVAPQLKALQNLGYREMSRVRDIKQIETLRAETYWAARRLNLTGVPFNAVDTIFNHVIEDVQLAIQPPLQSLPPDSRSVMSESTA